MNGASRGLDQGRFLVSEIVYLVHFLGFTEVSVTAASTPVRYYYDGAERSQDDVFRKSTRHRDASAIEVFAKE